MMKNNPDNYIKFLKRNHKTFQDKYFSVVDDLEQKLYDLDVKVPNDLLQLPELVFLSEWVDGEITSSQVHTILKSMNHEQTALKQLTRKLYNFMIQNLNVDEYIKETILRLKNEVVPMYATYLKILTNYFKLLSEIESKQEKLVWIEKSVDLKDKTTKKNIYEMTFDQLIKKFTLYEMSLTKDKAMYGQNTVTFKEKYSNVTYENIVIGPRQYVELISKKFQVKHFIFGFPMLNVLKTALEDLK